MRKKLWLGGLILAVALALVPAWAQRDRTIHGQALDKNSQPVVGAVVYLKNTRNLQVRTYIAAENGSFHFQGVSADADYELHAEHDGASSDTKRISSQDERREVHVVLKIAKK